MNKRYEILDSLPAYGPMYVPITDDNEPFYSEGFPIRFYKSDGSEWVANFKPGMTGLNKVFECKKLDSIVVISGGQGYLISPDNEKPIKTFGIAIKDTFQDEIGNLILVDDLSIEIIDIQTLEIWTSERISWDGFRDLKLTGDILSGQSFDPTNSINEWSDFSFNIKTKEITGGSYRDFTKRNLK